MKRLLVLLFAFAIAAPAAASDDFPSKLITLIVPYSAGGTDAQYRKLAELAGKELGQQIVVINKPGGAGTAAVADMARTAAPDGYTIAASTAPLLRQPHMMKVNFDPLNDFTWSSRLGDFTFVITVREDSPFKTLPELIQWAKENPGKLTYGSPGLASSQYIAMATLSQVAGIETRHIPYKGGNEIQNALLSNQVMVGVNTLAGVMPASGNMPGIRAIASFDAKRLESLPDLPTVREYGYDVVQESPYGLVGPKGMKPEVVARLQEAFRKAMLSPENAKLLESLRQREAFLPADEYTKWVAQAYEKEREAVERLKLRSQ